MLLFVVIITISWVDNEKVVKARDERVIGEKLTMGDARKERRRMKENTLIWFRENNYNEIETSAVLTGMVTRLYSSQVISEGRVFEVMNVPKYVPTR